MVPILNILIDLAILGIIFVFWIGHQNGLEVILEKWAEENSYKILEKEWRTLFMGPFVWSSRMQAVFYVTVEDQRNNKRNAWVLCGNYLGIGNRKNPRVEVRWDDATPRE